MRLSITIYLLLFSLCLAGQGDKISYGNWKFSHDNGLTFQDSFSVKNGRYILQVDVIIPEDQDTTVVYGVFTGMLAARKIFWDGNYLGSSGTIGTSKLDEVPGRLSEVHVIPPRWLSPGTHSILVEYSTFHGQDNMRFYGVNVVDYNKNLQRPIIATAFIHIYAGFFFIIGIFYLTRFILDRSQVTSLLFSLLCLLFFSLIIMEYVKNYWNYTYPWHFTRLTFILGITVMIALTLPYFFMSRLNLRDNWKWLMIPYVLIISCAIFLRGLGYDTATFIVMGIGFISASIICVYAYQKKKKDAVLLLITIIPITLILVLNSRYYDYILYIGFGMLVLINLISLAIRERKIVKEKEASLLLSSRLKLDLLKKNIQPHFLNNSLMSAIDWIEREPKKGVEFLFAISRELDIMIDISEKTLIPLVNEVELCRSHLSIMSFRKEIDYQLKTHNIEEYAVIPPAVLLTVIENGISHQVPQGGDITFTITEEGSDTEYRYSVHVNGMARDEKITKSSGTGFKYIQARLKESYGDKWSFSSQQVSDGWETVISFPR